MELSKMDSFLASKLKKIYLTDRREIQNYQLERWNDLLAYVHSKSSYYSCYPKSIQSLKEVEDMPFTTEDILLQSPEKLLLQSLSKINRIVTDTSSGTTKIPKRLFYSANDQNVTVEFFAWGLSEVIHSDKNVCIMMSQNQEGSVGQLIERALEIIEQRGYTIPEKWTFESLYHFIIQNHCGYLIGLPGHILTFSRWLGARKISLKLDGILVSADRCPKWMKKQIEEFFSCNVWNHYGSRESGLGGGVECGAFSGMHIREGDLYVEIVDKKGTTIKDGKEGEIVITTFHREAMPLIRYRTKDRGIIVSKPCECGGLTKRLMKVERGGSEPLSFLDENILGQGLADDLLYERVGEEINLTILGNKKTKTKHLQEMLCEVSEMIKVPLNIVEKKDILMDDVRPLSYGKRVIRE